MHRRAFVQSLLAPAGLGLGCAAHAQPAPLATPREPARPERENDFEVELRRRALSAMKRATRFMTETVAYKGGYLWAYLPDFSRCWGELEANRSMLWLQPPGTPSVGHVLLDAFLATGDAFYLGAAGEVAGALMTAQHPSGGWNYVYDFAGERSLAEWYASVAQSAWRLEEFHIHPDNATFDDACSAEATQFLLRLQLTRPEPALEAALHRALGFVRRSQYPNGGWPQRYPLQPDYTSFVTFNDDVLGENMKTLLMAHAAWGDPHALQQLRAAMASVVQTQQPLPQPGWGLQHDLEGRPAAGRSFEPAAFATHTTAANISLLLTFHELTGNPEFSQRVPEALDWLEKLELPLARARELGGTHPTFIRVGSDTALYVHRRGSNVDNGEYYVNESFAPPLTHYSPVRSLDLAGLRRRCAELSSRPAPLPRWLPERAGSVPLPRQFSLQPPTLLGLCGERPNAPPVARAEALRLVDELDPLGRWIAPLELRTNPYSAALPRPALGGRDSTYVSTTVGDRSDTSPYRSEERPSTYPPEPPLSGISVGRYIRNMATLIAYVTSQSPS
jgi:PelA/Pel-15E family pectate lyase